MKTARITATVEIETQLVYGDVRTDAEIAMLTRAVEANLKSDGFTVLKIESMEVER